MIRIRVKRVKRKSLTVGTSIFSDARVSLFARGVFCTALAMAQNKGFDITELLSAVPDETDDVYKGIMELRTKGYCKRVKVDGIVEFQFREDPFPSSRKASRVQNKSPLIYSKSMAHRDRAGKQGAAEDVIHEDAEFADWDEIDPKIVEHSVIQPSFLPERAKKSNPKLDTIPAVAHKIMHRLCFLVESESERLLLSAKDRGLVASVLGKLRDAGANLGKLNHFEDWWNAQWRSKDKFGAYQPPRPEQVLEFWTLAMKHNSYKPTPSTPREPQATHVNIAEIMRSRATSRNGA